MGGGRQSIYRKKVGSKTPTFFILQKNVLNSEREYVTMHIHRTNVLNSKDFMEEGFDEKLYFTNRGR